MVPIEGSACWAANAVFNASGFMAAANAWGAARSHQPKRLFWLVPAVLLSAWLESALNADVIHHAAPNAEGLAMYRRMAADLIVWPVLAAAVIWLRQVVQKSFLRAKRSLPTAARAAAKAEGMNGDLHHAAEHFSARADTGDAASVTAAYDPEFTCIRVADAGGFVRMTREQMATFWNRAVGAAQPGGHSIPTRETTIHHAETVGDTGFVLMTRIKDLGSGWEPLFYCLVWRKHDGGWRLLREFVHQKTIPRRL